MEIKIIKCLTDNFSYILFDKKTSLSAVIDPSEAGPIIEEIEKNNLNLKYVINTHHHYDHVGGNQELKEKYNCKIAAYEADKDRIPEIDINLKNDQTWKNELFKCKILHIPGHTSGHICIYINEINALFTGDTLFSLGCGRIFEGTYNQMFNSLEKIKKLPPKTKIYCGHEYTLQNSKFCIHYDENNKDLLKKIDEINIKLKNNKPTVPSTLDDELKSNIFLRSDNKKIQTSLNVNIDSPLLTFSKLRDLKDNF